ncbi:MAG: hypothetical protein KAJ14_08145, partial [Candidatus Omnitrophica bacterium]|nr:hypothetical protein [Candidatus Omnitrophota bacterium]
LLKNEKLINTLIESKTELFKDFSENKLEKCDLCAVGLENFISDEIHKKLITIYNELSDLKRILEKNK